MAAMAATTADCGAPPSPGRTLETASTTTTGLETAVPGCVDRQESQGPAAPPPREGPRLTNTTLFVLACMNFSDCVNMNLLTPYVASMVSHFLGEPKSSGGVLRSVGLLVGVYNLTEMLMSPLWGWLSGRIGRRPSLLLGFAGGCIMPVFFGMSESLAMAFVTRALNGVFCGNLSITKTYLAELVDETNEARAFSQLSFCYGMGMLVGPALGGSLVQPAVWAPSVFGGTIFESRPFLLPNLVYSAMASVAWFMGLFVLEETLPAEARGACAAEDAPPPAADEEEGGGRAEPQPLRLKLRRWLPFLDYPSELSRMMLAWGLVVGCIVATTQSFMLLVSLPRSIHGFALGPRTIGLMQNCAAGGLLTTQLAVFPRLARGMGHRFCIGAGVLLVLSVTLPFPAFGLLADGEEYGDWRLLPLGAMMFLQQAGFGLCTPSITIWVNRLAGTAGVDRGMVNGLSNSLAAFCRAVAPSISSGLLALGLSSGLPLGRYMPLLAVAAGGAVVFGLAGSVLPGPSPATKGAEEEAEEEEHDLEMAARRSSRRATSRSGAAARRSRASSVAMGRLSSMVSVSTQSSLRLMGAVTTMRMG